MIRLANWYFLLLTPLIILVFTIRRKSSTLKFSSIKLLKSSGMKKTIKHKIGKFLIVISVLLMNVALSRPQFALEAAPIRHQGIDIALILDVSNSMEIKDFEPNRLEVAKETMKEFIKGRQNDRMALVIFSGSAYTRIPMTLDHDALIYSLDNVTSKSIQGGNTAIGMAVTVGLSRLKKSDASSKIIILVTDGNNNAGEINPATAAMIAKELGVKVYCIGVGPDVEAVPVSVQGKNNTDETVDQTDTLQAMADTTGGLFYKVKDPQALSNVFEDIDKLEKTEFIEEHFIQYRELAFPILKVALVFMLLGIFFDRFYYIRIP